MLEASSTLLILCLLLHPLLGQHPREVNSANRGPRHTGSPRELGEASRVPARCTNSRGRLVTCATGDREYSVRGVALRTRGCTQKEDIKD